MPLTVSVPACLQATPDETQVPSASRRLEEALKPLTQLRALTLNYMRSCLRGPPAALCRLSRLEVFCCQWVTPRGARLPGGAWLSSLRQLVAPVSLLASSASTLAAAVRLEALALCFFGKASSAEQLAVVRWAACHPPLRQLCTGMGAKDLTLALFDAVVEAQRQNPSLEIRHVFKWLLEEEDCQGDMYPAA